MGERSLEDIVTELKFKDGDGDGGDYSTIVAINMTLVSNGVILAYMYDDGTELIEVYHDMKSAMQSIEMSFPIN